MKLRDLISQLQTQHNRSPDLDVVFDIGGCLTSNVCIAANGTRVIICSDDIDDEVYDDEIDDDQIDDDDDDDDNKKKSKKKKHHRWFI